MTHDPEAAWPLTTDLGYQGAETPTYPVAPPHVAPTGVQRVNNSYEFALAKAQLDAAKPQSGQGILIAKLSIILGAAIPLSAIAAEMAGLLGLIVAWIGIVFVAAIVMGVPLITKKD